jgi:hypothetical protein
MDVVGEPIVGGRGRCSTFGDVINNLLHGEEEGENLAPPGEMFTGGGNFEVDVLSDLDIADAERR